MNTRAHPPCAAPAFALLELLTFLGLLVILLAFLFPGIGVPQNAARRAQAAADLQSIATGLKAYYSEYNCYPVLIDPSIPAPPGAGGDPAVGDPAAGLGEKPNRLLFDTLRALSASANAGDSQNTRKIIFIESKSVSDPHNPHSGFQDSPTAPAGTCGCFFDPWGHQYCVVIGAGHPGEIDLSPYYKDFSGSSAPSVNFGAFSLGNDGKLGTNGDHHYRNGQEKSDDIVSWSN